MTDYFDFDQLLKEPHLRSGLVDVDGFDKPLMLHEMNHQETVDMLGEAKEVHALPQEEQDLHLAKFSARLLSGEFKGDDDVRALAKNLSADLMNNIITASQQFTRSQVIEKNS